MNETCGLAHAFTPKLGQVCLVLLVVFFVPGRVTFAP
jgi:hypothetical protein